MRLVAVTMALALLLAGCRLMPPGVGSHARFVRETSTQPTVGAEASAHLRTDKFFELPIGRGAAVLPVSPAYDASIVFSDELAMYEGLIRFGKQSPVGLLHGLGLGVTTFEENTRLDLGGLLGVFLQLGDHFYATGGYSGLMTVSTSSGDIHFAFAEVGVVTGKTLAFSPFIAAYHPLTGGNAEFSSSALLLGVALNVRLGAVQ